MAVTIESNTEKASDMVDALKAAGVKVTNEPTPPAESAPVVVAEPVVEKTVEPGPAGEPGGSAPAETEGKTEPEPEAGIPQETPTSQEPDEGEATPRRKSKGGFQVKVEKLTRQLEDTREQLDAERGDKTKLRSKIEELEAQLDTLQPKPATKDELVKPTRPVMPELSDFDDLAKYQESLKQYRTDLNKYDTDLDDYNNKRAEQKIQEQIAASDARRAQEESQRQYLERLNKSRAAYEDFNELREAIPDGETTITDVSRVVRDYIALKSKDPAHLIHYFLDDHVNNGAAEAARLLDMDEFDQLIEITALERKLVADANKAKEPEAVKAAAATATPEKKTSSTSASVESPTTTPPELRPRMHRFPQ